MKKVHFDGTHRVRHPHDTWAAIEQQQDTYGITRVADLTGLDTLGIPVALAARPGARSHTLSPGRGTTPLLARISAVMAAVELWHAEYACPPPALTRQPACDLQLPYRVGELPRPEGSLLSDRTPLDWISGTDATTGETTLVPRACVTLDHEAAPHYRPPLLSATTDGLAAGNSRAEAVTHALYELIERDCATPPATGPAARPVPLDPAAVDDALCTALLRRIAGAGGTTTLTSVPNRWGLPCFTARVTAPHLPAPATGRGAHTHPGIALARALTAAAQDRLLTLVTGPGEPPRTRPARTPPTVPATRDSPPPWRELSAGQPEFDEDIDEMRWLAGLLAQVTGRPPLVVDLSTTDAFAVVKVVTTRPARTPPAP